MGELNMNKDVADYKNINFDDIYTPFLKGLEELKISNKGAFVLFSSLGLKDEKIMKSGWKDYSLKGKGKELRSGTDNEYDPAIDILLSKLSLHLGEKDLADILTNETLLNKYVIYLMNIANLYCEKLLSEEFIEYKNGVSNNNLSGFVILVGNLIQKLTNQDSVF